MLSNFLAVLDQTLILTLLSVLGLIAGKTGILNDTVTDGLTNLLIFFISPCVMLSAFQREFSAAQFQQFLLTFVIGLTIIVFSALLTKLTIRGTNDKSVRVLRSNSIFSNCGMMSLPLQQALYGSDGIFLGAAYIAAFNVMFWTYGVALLGGSKNISVKKVLLNPCLIGTAAGLLFFFTSFHLPDVLNGTCAQMANLNTPIAMLIIGQRLSKSRISSIFDDAKLWLSAVIRLAIIPVAAILGMYTVGVRGTVAIICAIAASTPAAASNSMLAILFHQDESLSVKAAVMQNILSAITMPVIVAFAQAMLV